jgi:glutamate-1-semialdehyde aminotransferase
MFRGFAAIVEAYLIYWALVYLVARKGFKFSREWSVPLASGIATLSLLKTGEPYQVLEKLGAELDAQLAKKKDLTFQMKRVGSLFWPYFDRSGPVPTQAERITPAAVNGFKSRYQGWLERGVYLPPSAYEVGFLSAAHTTEHVTALVDALTGG